MLIAVILVSVQFPCIMASSSLHSPFDDIMMSCWVFLSSDSALCMSSMGDNFITMYCAIVRSVGSNSIMFGWQSDIEINFLPPLLLLAGST